MEDIMSSILFSATLMRIYLRNKKLRNKKSEADPRGESS